MLALFQECGVEVDRVVEESHEVLVKTPDDLLFRFSFHGGGSIRSSYHSSLVGRLFVVVTCNRFFSGEGFVVSQLNWPLKGVRHGLSGDWFSVIVMDGSNRLGLGGKVDFDKVLFLEDFGPFLVEFGRMLA